MGQRLRRPRYPADIATAPLPVPGRATAGASRAGSGTAEPAGWPAGRRWNAPALSRG